MWPLPLPGPRADPGAKIVETEKVIVLDGNKEKVTYELKIKADNKTLEVVLDEAGTVIGE